MAIGEHFCYDGNVLIPYRTLTGLKTGETLHNLCPSMPKDNEVLTVGTFREMFQQMFQQMFEQMIQENNRLLMKGIDARFDEVGARFNKVDERFEGVNGQFKSIDTRFEEVKTEFARVHREIGELREDVVDVLDRSIIPQLEEHRRDISLLKRAVTMA